MWRWAHFGGMARIARRLLPVLERELRMPVYPDQNTCWYYDDKIAQSYLLEAAGVPIPRTWVWYDADAACDWASTASYPLVLKLAAGAASANVRLVRSSDEARWWIERLFSMVVRTLDPSEFKPLGLRARVRHAGRVLLRGEPKRMKDNGYEPQTGYVLFQEFLPNNPFDTRVTAIGNRAFAIRRFNRANDFRASGSGMFDLDPHKIDHEFVRLAFSAAHRLKSCSCAIDGLYRNGYCVISEVSYTYVSSVVYDCPGHWQLNGSPESGTLTWIAGHMWPEEAQVSDFLQRLDKQLPTACS
jgi:hypothetical protein